MKNSDGKFLKFAVSAAIAGGIILLANYFNLQQLFRDILNWISNLGILGMLIFIALYIAACVLFLPGVILTLGAGVIFGVVKGSILVSIGSTIGATCAIFKPEVKALFGVVVPLLHALDVTLRWTFPCLLTFGDSPGGAFPGAFFASLAEFRHSETDGLVQDQWHVGYHLGEPVIRAVFGRDQQAMATKFAQPGLNAHGHAEAGVVFGRNGPVAQSADEFG